MIKLDQNTQSYNIVGPSIPKAKKGEREPV